MPSLKLGAYLIPSGSKVTDCLFPGLWNKQSVMVKGIVYGTWWLPGKMSSEDSAGARGGDGGMCQLIVSLGSNFRLIGNFLKFMVM